MCKEFLKRTSPGNKEFPRRSRLESVKNLYLAKIQENKNISLVNHTNYRMRLWVNPEFIQRIHDPIDLIAAT